MIDDNTLKSIEEDIMQLDPNAARRLLEQRKHRRIKRIEYNKRAYLKHREKLREQAREKYSPVIQSLDDHDPIDYDDL